MLDALNILAIADPASSGVLDGNELGFGWTRWIVYLPIISALLCGLCAALKIRNKLPAVFTVGLLGVSFLLTLVLYFQYDQAMTVHLFDWFNIHWGEAADAGSFVANFSLYIDKLTLLWMLFVTGLGALIALYASEYMEADLGTGYARFFAGVSVFLFAMTCLVMGDNLVMLYLGWEGVGFASYWLIGYYYQKPSAVAAAKKAFIMNRIGDLGLALGLYLTYHYFGTVEYAVLFDALSADDANATAGGWPVKAIPFLLMLGAFGKSAQFPLYVWLPDAMEGPTPVSALIHAATMVTAGVYLLCRMFPVMELHPWALPMVAYVGAFTALLSATIAMAQYDIKRIMAYSTVSQLGYMFAGVGFLTTFGAAYHVFTHAFFKAILFLTCGAIMHGFAGQLDLRKLSGLRRMKGWGVTAWTMLIGCLCLAGVPLTSGYFSKDAILAEGFVTAGPAYNVVGWVLLFTAGLTAYYTFRVWFRVCDGPEHYEMGDDHHGDDHDDHGHHHKPHAPRLAINLVLVVISIGAVLAAVPYFTGNDVEHAHGGWVGDMLADSTARDGVPGLLHHDVQLGDEVHHPPAHNGDAEHVGAHGSILGFDPHKAMYFISAFFGIVGILLAFWLHRAKRESADDLRATLLGNPATRWLPTAMENKWYVDEIYHAVIRAPLWIGSYVLRLIDQYFVDGVLVNKTAALPRWVAKRFQPLQNGMIQSYAISMAGGIALIALLALFMPEIREMLGWLNGGNG